MADPSELPRALGDCSHPYPPKEAPLPLFPPPKSGSPGSCQPGIGRVPKPRPMSPSESPALSLALLSVSACPLMLRPWLGVPRAPRSGCPDPAAALASRELRLTPLGASEAASSWLPLRPKRSVSPGGSRVAPSPWGPGPAGPTASAHTSGLAPPNLRVTGPSQGACSSKRGEVGGRDEAGMKQTWGRGAGRALKGKEAGKERAWGLRALPADSHSSCPISISIFILPLGPPSHPSPAPLSPPLPSSSLCQQTGHRPAS